MNAVGRVTVGLVRIDARRFVDDEQMLVFEKNQAVHK
jgi:hypothetical protein